MPELRPAGGELATGLKEARNLARREYAVASHRRLSAEELGLALTEFQTSLNRAVWDRTREDRNILSWAAISSGDRRALHEARIKKGVTVQDEFDPELSLMEVRIHGQDLDAGEVARREEERNRRNETREARRAANESQMPAATLQAEARKKIFDWFRARYPGAISLLDSYVSSVPKGQEPVDIDAFHDFIADSVGRWMLSRNSLAAGRRILVDKGPEGFKGRHETEEKVMRDMAEFLLEHASSFKDLKGQVELDKFDFWEEAVDSAWVKSRTEEVTLLLDERVGKFVLKEWLHRTGVEARDELIGRKIFETPYYKNIIRRLRIEGAKKNGVGGVLVDGPPGVGKTEIIQEKNKQKGYGTRVIGIHYYTSISELLHEKRIQVQGMGGAVTPSSLSEIVRAFDGETGQKFGAYMMELYKTLQAEGKITKGQNLTDFLRSFVTEDVEEIITKPELTEDDWEKVRISFLDRQKARILRTSMDPSYHETLSDIVQGEILLAIENNQMALLDEVDKAGPNSLGGLLTFLAKSPGRDVLKVGDKEIELPPWFNIDATSNSVLELDSYLKDRFAHLSISTPPVKDQLMIAGVRLSDAQGNILLSSREQRQLVGFFTYALPDINAFLQSEDVGMEPLSLRSVKDLTAYLVNFENMQRTQVGFGEALRMLLLQNRAWEKNPQLAKKFADLKARFPDIFEDKPLDLRHGPFIARRIDDLSGQRAAGYEGVLESPLITAISGMVDEPDVIKTGRPEHIVLSQDESGRVSQYMEKQRSRAARTDNSKITLPTGYNLRIKPGQGVKLVTLDGIAGSREESQHIADDAVSSGDTIVAASSDGGVVVLASAESSGSKKLLYAHLFDGQPYSSPELAKQPTEITQSREQITAAVDGRGTVISVLTSEGNGTLRVLDAESGKVRFERTGVEDFSLSEDGKYIVTQTRDGGSYLLRTGGEGLALLPPVEISGPPSQRQSRERWVFTRNNLLVKRDALGGVSRDSFLIVS
jgi:MoxR-like ATPase